MPVFELYQTHFPRSVRHLKDWVVKYLKFGQIIKKKKEKKKKKRRKKKKSETKMTASFLKQDPKT